MRRVDLEQVKGALAARDEPSYRSGQVWQWAARGASGYEAMTNLPTELRRELESSVPFSTLSLVDEAHSKDGTVKALFRTSDGHPVETVLMRYRDGRRSLCLSSQSGCPLTCTFCATGAMRFGRNLTPWEILDQALHFRRREQVDHAVFMGMGEPMLNFDNVAAAAHLLPDLGITHRRTTISTVGWLPGLRRFVDEVEEPIRLALSLHAADPALRSTLMPVNDRYPLEDVLAECRRYVALRRRKVFVEYVMLAGVNDRVEQARALARTLGSKEFKVNLIPYNPTGAFDGSSRKAIDAFAGALRSAGVPDDRPPHPRPRHRGRLRPARRDALTPPAANPDRHRLGTIRAQHARFSTLRSRAGGGRGPRELDARLERPRRPTPARGASRGRRGPRRVRSRRPCGRRRP